MAEVIFYAPDNARLTIGADDIQEEVRLANGIISKPSASLQFVEHLFRTISTKEQNVIRNCGTFKTGKIRELKNEAEVHQVLAEIAKKRLLGGPAKETNLPDQKMTGYVQTEGVVEKIEG